MRGFRAISAGALAVLLTASGSAFAFQETPAAPPPEADQATRQAAPQAVPPAVQLQTPGVDTEQGAEQTGAVFNFGFLPKLDFGLEVLYGDQHQQPLELQPGTFPEDTQDVTVVGKVKRRF